MVIAGIVAGGIGQRMENSTVPKQFLEIGGKPIVLHTVEKFLASLVIDFIIIGVHVDWKDYMEELLQKYLHGIENIFVTSGDASRNGTIFNIVKKANEICSLDDDTVFVTHDAVRPFVSLKIIEENVTCAKQYGVCDTVITATDTIVQSSNQDYITAIPIRNQMYQGQTPQSFKNGIFRQVYESMTPEEFKDATDACKMFYLRGHNVHLVKGDVSNFKITYPFELDVAKIMLGDYKYD